MWTCGSLFRTQSIFSLVFFYMYFESSRFVSISQGEPESGINRDAFVFREKVASSYLSIGKNGVFETLSENMQRSANRI